MTPMMEQYFEIKNKYKYYLVFFRLGDFYELFFDDALIASKDLEITLTGRDCGMEERAPMCGVPYHAADGYIAKLIAKGHKVAICEQVEDPKTAKTIVKRDVVRVVTPGTVLDTNVLDESKNNYIMCLYEGRSGIAMAVCDVTTGEFLTTEFKKKDEGRVIDEISRYRPSEIICNDGFTQVNQVETVFELKVYRYYDWAFEASNAKRRLLSHFNLLTLDGFGLKGSSLICASGALMEYLSETQKNSLHHISIIKPYSKDNFMALDLSSRRNLELTETIREKSKKGSLLWMLDHTKTAMGARLLRRWIEQPLLSENEINQRLGAVEELKTKVMDREELREYMNTVYDMERLMSKVVYQSANGRDLTALKVSWKYLSDIKFILGRFEAEGIVNMFNSLDLLEDLYELIDRAISPDAPFSVREGGMIQDGYSEKLDKFREALRDGKKWLADLEAKERELTGIKNLKIRYNKVFGYYIEITNSNKDLAPERYIRRQTLANAERFVTEELKEIENLILGADENINSLEYELFSDIREKVAQNVTRIQATAGHIALLDVFCSFADVADKNNYVRPVVNENGRVHIVNGRHPVVEALSESVFIPNDVYLDTDENRLAIVTGPNMAGKSTYMRQTALIVLMAQLGCFVPADTAEISIADRIFTRVGASDDLATGQSTFMVEMTEVANILNHATRKSLVILDEIGRGTSTFDGLSIAWSVLEYIADKKKVGAKTLFATHYHELTELEGKISGVKNYRILVEENGDDIIFLRKIARGGADNSYGIQVAKLAGLPPEVIDRSKEILSSMAYKLSSPRQLWQQQSITLEDEMFYKQKPETLAEPDSKRLILDELRDMDLDALTPREALQALYDIHKKLKDTESGAV